MIKREILTIDVNKNEAYLGSIMWIAKVEIFATQLCKNAGHDCENSKCLPTPSLKLKPS
jgi:hypothetical protein